MGDAMLKVVLHLLILQNIEFRSYRTTAKVANRQVEIRPFLLIHYKETPVTRI
jgi:hypothetical protein